MRAIESLAYFYLSSFVLSYISDKKENRSDYQKV